MAIYHFSGTIISRSQGRSAVACAAYRAGEELFDERYDKTRDYTKKKDVAYTEVLLPAHAPDWMKDRETLWNFVEKGERRKDAQLSREFNFALPRELTLEQNIELAKDFVTQEFVSKGMVTDLCIHNDKMPDGERQPHAHVMLTMRAVTPDGFGQKVREWNAKQNLLEWREAFAEVSNKHLFLHEHDIRIDHRTLEAQGIDLEPQYKIGASVASARMARLLDHQRIAQENGEKLIADPNIALNAITRQQSTFTRQDLARFVNRHTIDAEQFNEAYAKILASDKLILLGQDGQKRDRFTTKEMLAIESSLMQHAEKLNGRNYHPVNEKTQIRVAQKRNERNKSLSKEQEMAFAHLLSDGDLKNVIGYAGTGKSYLLGAAREAWEAQGYQVHGVTLSGIAAENLEGGSGIVSRTIASRTYYWDKGEQLLTDKDILVVDEAGMIGSRQLERLLAQAESAKAKIVLVGDPYQLQAIEAGAAFRAVSDCTPTVSLTEIRRQSIDWQREATIELATGKTQEAIGRYSAHDNVHSYETEDFAKNGLVALWNDVRIAKQDKTQIILTYTRDNVKSLNEMVRNLRRENNELGEDHVLTTARGERHFAEKDRVYFLKNDRDLEVKNGTLGTIARIQGNLLTITLDKMEGQKQQKTITFSTERYNELDHGYAATIHKSQGVTVDRTYVLASKYMDGHATYVGLSRHRESVDVFYSKEEFKNEQELSQILSRERSKDVTLDYLDYSGQRGFESAEQSQQNQNLKSYEHPHKQERPLENLLHEILKGREGSKERAPKIERAPEQKPTREAWQHKHQSEEVEDRQDLRDLKFADLQKTQHDEKLLQEAKIPQQAKEIERGEIEIGSRPKMDFKAFKAQFEREHPEQAKALREAMRPKPKSKHEQLALEAEKQINLLEKTIKESYIPYTAQDRLEKYVAQVAKQPEVMAYLKEHNKVLTEKIQTLSKSYEQNLDLDMEIDF
jgi:Ti-type conjugative transfer relaxase TraA